VAKTDSADSSSPTTSAKCRLEGNCLTSTRCCNRCCKMQLLSPRRAISGWLSRSASLPPPTVASLSHSRSVSASSLAPPRSVVGWAAGGGSPRCDRIDCPRRPRPPAVEANSAAHLAAVELLACVARSLVAALHRAQRRRRPAAPMAGEPRQPRPPLCNAADPGESADRIRIY
jgi:hypothetical protein